MAHNQITETEYQRLSPDQRLARGHAVTEGKAWDARSTWGDTDYARRIAVTADPVKAKARVKPPAQRPGVR